MCGHRKTVLLFFAHVSLIAAASTEPSLSDADSVYIYYEVLHEGRYDGGNVYAIRPGTSQLELKCHVIQPSTPLKWFLETEANERIDLATVDYATQSVETFEELPWLPEVSEPLTTFTLIVKNFTKELAGKYSCEAYKGETKVGSREYILNVDEGTEQHAAR